MSTSLLEYSVSQHWQRTRWVLTSPYSSCMSHVRALTVTEHATSQLKALQISFLSTNIMKNIVPPEDRDYFRVIIQNSVMFPLIFIVCGRFCNGLHLQCSPVHQFTRVFISHHHSPINEKSRSERMSCRYYLELTKILPA